MKQIFITSDPASKALILIFSGWATDETLFAGLAKKGYDIMVVYDYRDQAFDLDAINRYREIVVIGWSFGIYFADRFIHNHPELPITRCIAINGTLNPIDNEEGIPEEIFEKTALLPDARALDKFYTRICGGARARKELMPVTPNRDLDELRDELAIIRNYIAENGCHPADYVWDFIFLADADLIFPIENSRNAWDDRYAAIVVLEDKPHLPDFQEILNKYIVSKLSAEEKFIAAQNTYDDNAEVQRQVAMDIYKCDIANLPIKSGQKILEIGSGTGFLTAMYAPKYEDSDILLIDFNPADHNSYNDTNRRTYEAADAELRLRELPDKSFDMVYSSSTIQWFNSPHKALREITRILRPGGRAVISYFDENNLWDLWGLMPILRCPTITEGNLYDLGYEEDENTLIPITYPMEFPNPLEALRHLRNTGVTGLGNAPLSPGNMRLLMKAMAEEDGSARIVYSVKHLTLDKMAQQIFVTGIDTDAGKSYATGWLGRLLREKGLTVRTQKFIQTGNVGRSEDIELHRSIMGDPIEGEDWSLSAPVIYSYPASPDLAARIDGRPVDFTLIDRAREANAAMCDVLLIEGAGGPMVPIDDETLTIDYVTSRGLPVALVTNGRLGSINHTLLALEALESRGIELRYLLYNTHFDADLVIVPDTRRYLKAYLSRKHPNAEWVDIPSLTKK